jgi:alpha-glucosidase
MIRNTSFSAGLIDLSSPAARQWVKDLIRRELIGSGASGWMADFGAGFPPDGVISADIPGQQFHNMYPELWAQVNREAIEEAGLGDTATFFMRSGYTRSPRHATLFWLGDQLVSWDRHDGIKTAVTGMLSSGVSGFAFQHGDVGGYTTLSHPLLAHHRSRELLMRWAELGAWNVVFRTHEGNRPADNHQFFSDRETLLHVARMARLHACWEPYRRRLVEEAARRGAAGPWRATRICTIPATPCCASSIISSSWSTRISWSRPCSIPTGARPSSTCLPAAASGSIYGPRCRASLAGTSWMRRWDARS